MMLTKVYSPCAVCDPVMGDDERLYVSKDLVPAYRDQIVPLATVLTPNQYEAELLTGTKIDSKASAVAACQALHQSGVATVVRPYLSACYMACGPNELRCGVFDWLRCFSITQSRESPHAIWFAFPLDAQKPCLQPGKNPPQQPAVSGLAVKQRLKIRSETSEVQLHVLMNNL